MTNKVWVDIKKYARRVHISIISWSLVLHCSKVGIYSSLSPFVHVLIMVVRKIVYEKKLYSIMNWFYSGVSSDIISFNINKGKSQIIDSYAFLRTYFIEKKTKIYKTRVISHAAHIYFNTLRTMFLIAMHLHRCLLIGWLSQFKKLIPMRDEK